MRKKAMVEHGARKWAAGGRYFLLQQRKAKSQGGLDLGHDAGHHLGGGAHGGFDGGGQIARA